jgi:hypothetical protein
MAGPSPLDATATQAELTIHVATMPYAQDRHRSGCVANVGYHAVVANANSAFAFAAR